MDVEEEEEVAVEGEDGTGAAVVVEVVAEEDITSKIVMGIIQTWIAP